GAGAGGADRALDRAAFGRAAQRALRRDLRLLPALGVGNGIRQAAFDPAAGHVDRRLPGSHARPRHLPAGGGDPPLQHPPGGAGGLGISTRLLVPTGGAVVLALSLLFFVTLAVGALRLRRPGRRAPSTSSPKGGTS